jgi:hypothetical protein
MVGIVSLRGRRREHPAPARAPFIIFAAAGNCSRVHVGEYFTQRETSRPVQKSLKVK